MNFEKLKIRLFEGITPKYYHGKEFEYLESDLEMGFLKGYIDDRTDYALAISHKDVPEYPCIYLTRDRKKWGKLRSGLEQAKIFSERENEGIIYIFNSEIINLGGYEDDGSRNIIVREPINLHKFLEKIIINSKIEGSFDKAKKLISKMNYSEIKLEKLA